MSIVELLPYCYYGASEASVVFRRLTEISEYGRPAGRGYAFARAISQQPLDRFACGNCCRVTSSLLPTNEQLSMHVVRGTCPSVLTCHVQYEGVSVM